MTHVDVRASDVGRRVAFEDSFDVAVPVGAPEGGPSLVARALSSRDPSHRRVPHPRRTRRMKRWLDQTTLR